MQISISQQEAVTHGAGPVMVLAGPGSGKTFVITQRILYMIRNLRIPPEKILVITFTRAAAREMKTRFESADKHSGVTFGTFHSVFFQILRAAYHFSAENILSEDQKFKLLRKLTERMQITGEETEDLLGEIAAEISLMKNEMISPDHYYARSCPDEMFRGIYRDYEKTHREMGLLDYDDMLVYTRELFRERPDILNAWRARFSHILVDEFQDINTLQYDILKMLASPLNNLFVVGDDDQSIYRFRGAKPEIMMRFGESFPNADIIRLGENYRSTPQIISASRMVIEENRNRFAKEIRAVRKNGPEPVFYEAGDVEEECLFITGRIRHLVQEENIPLSEIAILVRTNQNARPYAEKLMEFNLPFLMKDSLPDIYEHWMAKDFLAYLKLAGQNQEGRLDREAFLRVMNRPKRYLSRENLSGNTVRIDELLSCYRDKEWMQDRISMLEAHLRVLARLKPYAAVNFIRQGIGYDDFLKEYALSRKMDPRELLDLAFELQESARPYATVDEWMEHMEEYRARLKKQRFEKKTKKEDALTLATFHGSKGLEFSCVFLADVNEGIIPHQKALREADMEEERRLLYVGMTRAKQRLWILWVRKRYGRVCDPSRFLEVFDLEVE